MKGETRNVTNIIKDERGVVIIWILLFMPFLLMATNYTITQTQAVTGADIDLQAAVQSAVKAAAGQVTSDSQAAGDARVNTVIGHSAFRRELARNLGLDQTTFSPLSGSFLIEAPEYVLVIYNGDDTYVSRGAEDAKVYQLSSGALSSTGFLGTGFPYTFGIDNSTVYLSASGIKQVTLDRPGVVAVVTVKHKKLMGSSDPNLQMSRWASAKIVY